MTRSSLARFLTDFSQRQDAEPLAVVLPSRGSNQAQAGDVRARDVREAFADGEAKGRASAETSMQAALAQQREQLLAERAQERTQWIEGAAAEFARELKAGLGDIETRIADKVGRTLEPFVEDALRERVMADLKGVVRALLSDEHSFKMAVSGPREFVSVLGDITRFPQLVGARFEEGAFKLAIAADDTVIETPLQEWIEQLRRAVA